MDAILIPFAGHSLLINRGHFWLKTPVWMTVLTKQMFIHRPNVVFAPHPYQALFLVVGRRVRMFKTKLIYHFAGFGEQSTLARRTLETFLLREADGIVTVDEPLALDYARHFCRFSIPGGNLVDTDYFKLDDNEYRNTRGSLGIEGRFVIGMVGPFDANYNGPALEWLRRTIDSFPEDFLFLLIGSYNSSDFIDSKKVMFAGKALSDNYRRLLTAMDCLLAIRFVDTPGTSNKILEAMSMKKPVVALQSMHVPTGARDGQHLFTTTISGVPDILTKLASDPALRKKVGGNGRVLVEHTNSLRSFEGRIQWLFDSAQPNHRESMEF